MKITLHSTGQIVELDGCACRVWEGKTEGGVKLTAFIARVAVDRAEDTRQFEHELTETPQPKPTEAWPSRLTFMGRPVYGPGGKGGN